MTHFVYGLPVLVRHTTETIYNNLTTIFNRRKQLLAQLVYGREEQEFVASLLRLKKRQQTSLVPPN